jgi:hypothetical protein
MDLLNRTNWVAPAVALLFGTGCGDLIGAIGDEGKLEFYLVTDYELEETDLRDAVIVAGHEQRIDISLTSKGNEEIEDARDLEYRMVPSAGWSIEPLTGEATENDPPDMHIVVSEPGVYEFQAMHGDEVFDSLELEFEDSNALELSVRVRSPWGENFDTVPTGQTSVVEEGSQATFLAIPLGATGNRLAGDLEVEARADPIELVVPGESIGGVYEDGYWLIKGAIDFYFINPGEVTISLEDTVSGAIGSHDFTIEPIQSP